MIKKTILFSAFTLCTALFSNAQYLITNYTSATAGVTENYPVDVEYNSFNQRYTSLHSNSVGMSVINYDANTGVRLNSLNFFKTGNNFTPIKILHQGTNSYILFSLMSGSTTRFAICKYNNSTNALIWCSFLNNTLGTIDESPADMALDPAGNVYVVGSYTSTSGDQDIFIANVSTAGSLLWNNQYVNTTYNETAMNIYYDAPSNEFIVGASACAVSNCLGSRFALVERVNTTGAVLASTLINYPSNTFRISNVCAKRTGSYVYVTATSYVGADGAGPFFIAKLTPATLALSTYKQYFGPTYFNAEFNFTNNNTDLLLCGSASFVNTLTPGMVNTMFALSNCAFVSESRYTSMGSYAWGGYMANGYNPTLNELGTVVNDPNTPNHFYFAKSDFRGNTSCEAYPTYSLNTYTLQNNAYSNTVTKPAVTFPPIKLFSIAAMSHDGVNTCYFVPCPGCAMQGYTPTVKSMDVSSTHELNVFPNPANEKVTVSIEEEETVLSSIELFDISGRLINAQRGLAENSVSFDINNLEKGIYVLKVTMTSGKVEMKKFIKE